MNPPVSAGLPLELPKMPGREIVFGSVCSGIGAPELAFTRLGWNPAFMSEIEAFPRSVLAARYGAVDAARTGASRIGVPLWGDFTALRVRHFDRLGVLLPDVLIGGTPCQDFSQAGLRAGLDGARGGLTMDFARLANAIDNARRARGLSGLITCWENVPGVLSHKGNPLGHFLGAMVGEDAPLVPGRKQKWTDAGLVVGPKRAAAWRILDAQFFGLAQRRERVFAVICPLDGPDPSEILFERKGVRGDSKKGRDQEADIAGTVGGNSPGGGWRIGADEAAAGHVVAHTLRGEGFDASEDGTGRGTPLVAAPITAAMGRRGGQPDCGDTAGHLIAGTLNANGKAAGSATQQDAESGMLVPIARTLSAHAGPHGRLDATTETLIPVIGPIPFYTTQITSGENRSNPQPGSACHSLPAAGHAPAIAFDARQQDVIQYGDKTGPLDTDGWTIGVQQASADVRRLLPVECERLQGFPDGWTDVPYRGKPAADGPRYRALGNSMAVPVIAWIGRRIELVIALSEAQPIPLSAAE